MKGEINKCKTGQEKSQLGHSDIRFAMDIEICQDNYKEPIKYQLGTYQMLCEDPGALTKKARKLRKCYQPAMDLTGTNKWKYKFC